MGKRKRVRFADGVGEGDVADERSLLADDNEAGRVTRFAVESEEGDVVTENGVLLKRVVRLVGTDSGDESSSGEEGVGEGLRLERRERRRVEEDGVWSEEEEEGDGKRDKKRRRRMVAECEAIAGLVGRMRMGECVERLVGRVGLRVVGAVVEEAGGLGRVGKLEREGLLEMCDCEWELRWGEGNVMGCFSSIEMERWGKAGYFRQNGKKVGWIRVVGGGKWVEAGSIFWGNSL